MRRPSGAFLWLASRNLYLSYGLKAYYGAAQGFSLRDFAGCRLRAQRLTVQLFFWGRPFELSFCEVDIRGLSGYVLAFDVHVHVWIYLLLHFVVLSA